MATPGINLIGHISTNLGLGVAARNTARLIQDEHVPMSIVDIHTAAYPGDRATEWEHTYWKGKGPAPYSVNLFHMNPPEIRAEMRLDPAWVETTGHLNACVPFWELTSLPTDWHEYIRSMDIVLAPTRFVGDVIRRSVPDATILHFPQSVYVPQRVVADRSRWGFSEGEVVFVTSFDLNSDPARKNPWGAIEAFRRARRDLGQGARLVVKVGSPTAGMGIRHAARLRDMASHEDGITLIEAQLSYEDVLSLYASADAFVSLHRAEGLGLGLLESMMLGTPVIATAYSGNMDFMTIADSCLVGYTMVAASTMDERSSYALRKIGTTQEWAEPDLDEAAEWMVRIARDPHLRSQLSHAAKDAAVATLANPARVNIPHKLVELSTEPRKQDVRFPTYSRSRIALSRGRRVLGRAIRALMRPRV